MGDKRMRPFVLKLGRLCAQWNYLTARVMVKAIKDREAVGSAATDFLMFSGYVTMAYAWAQMAQVAFDRLATGKGSESTAFYQAKVQTAEFYFERILPRTRTHAECILSPSKYLMQMPIDSMSFEGVAPGPAADETSAGGPTQAAAESHAQAAE
jgi:hypothetical protein